MDCPSNTKVIFSSDPAFENLLTEVYFDDFLVYSISVDSGIDNMTVIIPGNNLFEGAIKRNVSAEWLINSLNYAKYKTYNRHTMPPPPNPWAIT